MILSVHRTGGAPPSEDERIVLEDDGRCEVWRSVGGSRAGAFAMQVAPDDRALIVDLVAVCRSTPGEERLPALGGARERLELGAASQTVPADDRPDGPWGSLLQVVRPLFQQALDHPLAALELAIDRSSGSARISHLGTLALGIDRRAARVDGHAYDASGAWQSSWQAPREATRASRGEETANSAWLWRIELPSALLGAAWVVVEAQLDAAFEGRRARIALRARG